MSQKGRQTNQKQRARQPGWRAVAQPELSGSASASLRRGRRTLFAFGSGVDAPRRGLAGRAIHPLRDTAGFSLPQPRHRPCSRSVAQARMTRDAPVEKRPPRRPLSASPVSEKKKNGHPEEETGEGRAQRRSARGRPRRMNAKFNVFGEALQGFAKRSPNSSSGSMLGSSK